MATTQHIMASVAASTTGFATSVTGASFTLTSTTVSDGLAHLVTVTNLTANTHAGKTIAVVGTDENGNVQSETITGPAGSATVTTTKFFKTLTSVTPSATIGADTFSIGYGAGSRGQWFQPETNIDYPVSIGVGCTVVAGSPNYSLKYTYDRSSWFTHATITGKTASFDGSIVTPVAAACIEFTAAGSVTATYIQAANRF